jgi:hypothetical protein
MSIIEVNNPVEGTFGLLRNAGAPTNGTAGTGTYAGKAPKGCLLVDTTNAILYINTGTQASVTWTKVGTQT